MGDTVALTFPTLPIPPRKSDFTGSQPNKGWPAQSLENADLSCIPEVTGSNPILAITLFDLYKIV